MKPEQSIQGTRRSAGGAKPDAHAGDDRAGFELFVDRPRRVLKIRMWGLWDLQIAEQFRTDVLSHGRALPRPWAIVADTRQFVAQSDAVTDIRKDVMQRILQLGCHKVAALGEHAVYSMQFKRIAGESHMKAAVFHDEDAALVWASEREDAASR